MDSNENCDKDLLSSGSLYFPIESSAPPTTLEQEPLPDF